MNAEIQQLLLWPTRVWAVQFNDEEFNQRLYKFVMEEHKKTEERGFDFEDERCRLFNLFQYDNPDVQKLKEMILEVARNYIGPQHAGLYDPIQIDGRAVIVVDRDFIQTHVERRESDLTMAYFLSGDGAGKPLNSIAEPNFVIEDPSRASTDLRFPDEDRQSFVVAPRPGLLMVFPPHVPHHQRPYRGEKPHVQIVCNVRIPFKNDYFKWKK